MSIGFIYGLMLQEHYKAMSTPTEVPPTPAPPPPVVAKQEDADSTLTKLKRWLL